MASPKLLLGGLVGVGSISTAGVFVAHKQGFFSSSNNQTQSSGDTSNAGTPNNPGSSQAESDTTPTVQKPNQAKVEKWLTTNKGESENWEIKIKKNDQEPQDFKDSSISEDDLKGLKDYLSASERENLLKSLFSKLEPKTLTFEKTGDDWKHILTKEDIEKWVKETSDSKATLKLSERNEAKEFEKVPDLNNLFEGLFGNKNVFQGLESTKNILFERIKKEDEKKYNWKHTKTEISNLLKKVSEKGNKLEVKIGENKDSAKELDQINEEDLIGLLNFLGLSWTQSLFPDDEEDPTGKTVRLTLAKKVTSDSQVKQWELICSEEESAATEP